MSNWEQAGGKVSSSRAIRGGAAIAASNAGRQLLRLAVVIVLARLLTPEEFGVVAVMTALFAVGAVFQEMGLSAATVQRSAVSRQSLSTLFWINSGIGVLLTAGFAGLAPLIAGFFGRPELALLCRIASCTFLLNGLAVQHRALLQRDMRFGSQAATGMSAAALGGACALGMAATGWGYWSLVGQILVTDLVTLLLLLRAVHFVPGRPRMTTEVVDMLRFGGSLFGFNLVLSIAQNLNVALLGRSVGAAAAGLYTRGFTLASLPLGLLSGAAAYVALPKLSQFRESDAGFADFYYRGVQLIALVTAPVALLFALLGDTIALCVYGPQWVEAGPLLRIFGLGLLVSPLLHSTGQVFLARGQSQRMFRWGVFGACVIGAGTVLGLRWGAVGVAWGWSLSTLTLLVPGLVYAFRGTSISIGGVARSVVRVYCAAAAAAPLGLGVRRIFEDSSVWLQLGVTATLVLLAYIALCYFALGQKPLIREVAQGVFRRARSVS